MQLSDSVEVLSATYLVAKGYIKETELVSFAEEWVRELIEQGFEYSDIVDEFHELDQALADAIDDLSEEFGEEEDW